MRIKKISPTTPANGNIENQYGTSQTNAYSEEYSNNTFATKDVATTSANGLMSASDKAYLDTSSSAGTIWSGNAYQVNDELRLAEELVLGRVYIVKFYGNSGSYFNYDFFVYDGSTNGAAQISYYAPADNIGFRYRLDYNPTTKKLKINDAVNGATNRAIIRVFKLK